MILTGVKPFEKTALLDANVAPAGAMVEIGRQYFEILERMCYHLGPFGI